LVSVTHKAHDYSCLSNADFHTLSDKSVQHYENKLTAVTMAHDFVPLQQHKKPKVYGYQPAIVVSSHDKDLYCNKEGSIKVQFPWDKRDKYNEQSSCWIRLTQSATGTDFCQHILPHKNQIVAIAFLDGDIDKPVCIGAIYSPSQKESYSLPQQLAKSGIKMRLMQQGKFMFDKSLCHQLTFDDTAHAEKISLIAQKQLTQEVFHNENIHVEKAYNHLTDHCLMQIDGHYHMRSSKQWIFKTANAQIEIKPDSIVITSNKIKLA
jgi:type VI secretion system secreted protein VgrG